LTEVAETNQEDVEFLRTKFRELKTQARDELDVLRRDRDQMREYKQIRDEHNKEVKALIESVKAEREERDRINKDINEAKERRRAIHAQLKSVYDEIRDLRGNLVGSPSNDQRRMMRRVEELEWRQQTEQISRDEEVSIGEEKEKQDRISEQRRLARKLKEEATEAHTKVLTLSEQSQIHHQEVVRIRPQLEEYKKSADTAHKNFVEWLKKVKEGETRLKEQRTQIDDIQTKLRKHSVDRHDVERDEQRVHQKAQERERVESAVEKLQSGKRLTFDEFILAQRTVSSGKKRSKKQKRRTEEFVPEPAATVEPEPEKVVKEEPAVVEVVEPETEKVVEKKKPKKRKKEEAKPEPAAVEPEPEKVVEKEPAIVEVVEPETEEVVEKKKPKKRKKKEAKPEPAAEEPKPEKVVEEEVVEAKLLRLNLRKQQLKKPLKNNPTQCLNYPHVITIERCGYNEQSKPETC